MIHTFKNGPFGGRSYTLGKTQLDEPKHMAVSIPRGVGIDAGLAWGQLTFFNDVAGRRSSANAAVYSAVYDAKTGEKTGEWVLVPA